MKYFCFTHFSNHYSFRGMAWHKNIDLIKPTFQVSIYCQNIAHQQTNEAELTLNLSYLWELSHAKNSHRGAKNVISLVHLRESEHRAQPHIFLDPFLGSCGSPLGPILILTKQLFRAVLKSTTYPKINPQGTMVSSVEPKNRLSYHFLGYPGAP